MKAVRRWSIALVAPAAWTIWFPMGQPVPVERVLANVQAQIAAHPGDASSWLVLARVHSYIFSTGSPQIPMQGANPHISYLPQAAQPPKPSPENLEHRKQSIAAFRKSIELDPKPALPYLGLAWVLEQGADLADPAAALDNYRQAYDRASPGELSERGFPPFYEAISQEAAERIIVIQKRKPNDAAARAEIARLEPIVATLRQKPRAITPVIFSFREATPLCDLVAPDIHVAFDLDGLGGRSWTWLQSDTGILVWDPLHSRSIQSGLQLFGSVTWWMFWRDGFQALAALDDNHDGSLSGRELAGLAVWIDRNQNGRSDPGEVLSLADAGIVRISVQAAADATGTLSNVHGIQFSDGRQTPSYDWIAASVAR
jgi:hypothetical protein